MYYVRVPHVASSGVRMFQGIIVMSLDSPDFCPCAGAISPHVTRDTTSRGRALMLGAITTMVFGLIRLQSRVLTEMSARKGSILARPHRSASIVMEASFAGAPLGYLLRLRPFVASQPT